jgi:hypothetical protein
MPLMMTAKLANDGAVNAGRSADSNETKDAVRRMSGTGHSLVTMYATPDLGGCPVPFQAPGPAASSAF